MLSTKFRSTAVVMLAASSVALAAAVTSPVASASKNNGGFSKSGEGLKLQESCQSSQITWENFRQAEAEAFREKDISAAFKAADAADLTKSLAHAAGCSWAAPSRPPTPVRVTPGAGAVAK